MLRLLSRQLSKLLRNKQKMHKRRQNKPLKMQKMLLRIKRKLLTILPKNSRKLMMLQRRHKRMQIMLQRKLLTQLKRTQLTQKLLNFSQPQTLLRLLLMIKLPPETLSNLKLMQQSLQWKM